MVNEELIGGDATVRTGKLLQVDARHVVIVTVKLVRLFHCYNRERLSFVAHSRQVNREKLTPRRDMFFEQREEAARTSEVEVPETKADHTTAGEPSAVTAETWSSARCEDHDRDVAG